MVILKENHQIAKKKKISMRGVHMMQAPRYKYLIKKIFSDFSTKTYVVDAQKNRLNETVLLSTQNIC